MLISCLRSIYFHYTKSCTISFFLAGKEADYTRLFPNTGCNNFFSSFEKITQILWINLNISYTDYLLHINRIVSYHVLPYIFFCIDSKGQYNHKLLCLQRLTH